jgi:hypothetical protein
MENNSLDDSFDENHESPISEREEREIKRFARKYFPKGCDFYVDGELNIHGFLFAYGAFVEKSNGQKPEHPCCYCSDNICKARKKPYEK